MVTAIRFPLVRRKRQTTLKGATAGCSCQRRCTAVVRRRTPRPPPRRGPPRGHRPRRRADDPGGGRPGGAPGRRSRVREDRVRSPTDVLMDGWFPAREAQSSSPSSPPWSSPESSPPPPCPLLPDEPESSSPSPDPLPEPPPWSSLPPEELDEPDGDEGPDELDEVPRLGSGVLEVSSVDSARGDSESVGSTRASDAGRPTLQLVTANAPIDRAMATTSPNATQIDALENPPCHDPTLRAEGIREGKALGNLGSGDHAGSSPSEAARNRTSTRVPPPSGLETASEAPHF